MGMDQQQKQNYEYEENILNNIHYETIPSNQNQPKKSTSTTKKNKQKLFQKDLLNNEMSIQQYYTNNLHLKNNQTTATRRRSNSYTEHDLNNNNNTLIRESSINVHSSNASQLGFEAIIPSNFNPNMHNRSMSFDNTSSICTNETNDSLSSLYHLFST